MSRPSLRALPSQRAAVTPFPARTPGMETGARIMCLNSHFFYGVVVGTRGTVVSMDDVGDADIMWDDGRKFLVKHGNFSELKVLSATEVASPGVQSGSRIEVRKRVVDRTVTIPPVGTRGTVVHVDTDGVALIEWDHQSVNTDGVALKIPSLVPYGKLLKFLKLRALKLEEAILLTVHASPHSLDDDWLMPAFCTTMAGTEVANLRVDPRISLQDFRAELAGKVHEGALSLHLMLANGRVLTAADDNQPLSQLLKCVEPAALPDDMI